MSKGLPRWFRLAFVLVMIILCFVVVTQLIAQRSYSLQLDELHNDIEIANGQLALQKKQNRQYLEEKDVLAAQIAELKPIAETEAARTDALRDQKKALNKELTELTAQQADEQTRKDLILTAVLEALDTLHITGETAE